MNLWDTRKLDKRFHALEGHKEEVQCVSWCPDSESLLATCGQDARARCGLALPGDRSWRG